MTTTQTYFISSGRLNAMYTLRVIRSGHGFHSENYLGNLSTDPELAEAKARDYFDRIAARIGNSPDLKLVFAGYADFELGERRMGDSGHRMSTQDTMNIELIESGEVPFGKHRGRKLEDLDAGYLLWWVDQGSSTNPVAQAMIHAATGVALEKGYIAAREEKRAEIAEQKSKSVWIGEVKERREFEGVCDCIRVLDPVMVAYNTYADRYMVTFIVDGNEVVYFGGTTFGAKVGESMKFKATIKAHSEYKGTKQTIIQRPKEC